jgi:cobalt-zinc-cadmium efflux system protein
MHSHASTTKALVVAVGITATFFVIELAGGILTNSLALQTDAFHMLTDIVALAYALVAARLAQRPVSLRRTYGYYRVEILSAFLNGILLWAVVIFVFYEAIQRIQYP